MYKWIRLHRQYNLWLSLGIIWLACVICTGCMAQEQVHPSQPEPVPAEPSPKDTPKITQPTPPVPEPLPREVEAKPPQDQFKPIESMLDLDALPEPVDHVTKRELAQKKLRTSSEETVKIDELAFDNEDLYSVLDKTLFELFKVNYIIDPSIKAKVTMHISDQSFTTTEFINFMNDILQLTNLSVVKGPGSLYKIVRKNASQNFGHAPIEWEDNPMATGDITRWIKVRYLAAATAARNIKPFLSKGASILRDSTSNSIVITDNYQNVDKALTILSLMDVPFFNDITWKLFPIRENDAADIVKDISTILKSAGLFNRAGYDKGNFEIFSIKTMNAILVLTRWPSMMSMIEEWISILDRADESSGTEVFVYFVENGTASELSDILKQLYGGTKSNTKTNRTSQGSASQKKQRIVEPTRNTTVSGELTGKIEIISDDTNNAIVFKASRRDYKTIREVLKQLDVVPRQVLINVLVAEIKLSEELQYGVEWFLQGHRKDYTGQGAFDNQMSRPIDTKLGAGTSGFTYGIYDAMDFMRGLVKALGNDANVNILSSPNILAVDNKEAYIEVGEEVPTETGKVTDSNGGSTSTVQFKKTGIILKVTPHINSSGLVKMELSQEVSKKGEKDEALNNYTTLIRKAETSLVVRDTQTIVMGGLMDSEANVSEAGIPFLKDIPLLGYLFKSGSRELRKTELIFLITPRVISTGEQADQITREFSQKVEGVKGLIEENKL